MNFPQVRCGGGVVWPRLNLKLPDRTQWRDVTHHGQRAYYWGQRASEV